MKKIYLSTLIISLGLFLSTPELHAQTDKGNMRLGGQLAFGTEIESLGIGANFDYAITDAILLAPSLVYFFGKSEGEVSWSLFEVNLNGNYLFDTGNSNIIPYALAGLNLSFWSVDYEGFGFGSLGNSTNVGLNIGGGADFVVSTFFVFGELRYVISSSDQLVIAGGVKFPLN